MLQPLCLKPQQNNTQGVGIKTLNKYAAFHFPKLIDTFSFFNTIYVWHKSQ